MHSATMTVYLVNCRDLRTLNCSTWFISKLLFSMIILGAVLLLLQKTYHPSILICLQLIVCCWWGSFRTIYIVHILHSVSSSPPFPGNGACFGLVTSCSMLFHWVSEECKFPFPIRPCSSCFFTLSSFRMRFFVLLFVQLILSICL